nr:hypothetical protein [Cytophagales bacterium]
MPVFNHSTCIKQSPRSVWPRRLLLFLTVYLSGISAAVYGQTREYTYYDDEESMIKEAYFLVNGQPHGPYEVYDNFGNLIQSGNLVQGKKEGPFIYLYPGTTDTLRIINYQNNLREGEAFSWHVSGELAQKATYKEDVLTGEVIAYHEEGTVRNITHFKDNVPHGNFKEYYASGILAESAVYDNGLYEGERLQYDDSGKLIQKSTYSSGNLEGAEVTYSPQGNVLSEISYARGVKHGPSIVYYENGNVEKKGQYIKGRPHGEFITYREDGQIAEVSMFNKGRPVGEVIAYHENGAVKSRKVHNAKGQTQEIEVFDEQGNLLRKSLFVNGTLHGPTKTFFPSGTIKEIIPYQYGELDGRYLSHTEEGNVVIERTYQRGRVMKEKVINKSESNPE